MSVSVTNTLKLWLFFHFLHVALKEVPRCDPTWLTVSLRKHRGFFHFSCSIHVKKKPQQQQKTEMRACIRKTVTKMHLQLVQQNLNKYIKHMHTACHYSQ